MFPTISSWYDLQSTSDNAISIDYNGNGFGDVIFYRPGSKLIFLASSKGNGTFAPIFFNRDGLNGYDFSAYTDKVIALDYNGDGYEDMLCYRPGSKLAWLFRSNGDGTYTVVFANSNGISGYNLDQLADKVISFDYNHDGYDDLLCYRPGSKAAWLLKSNGNGTFSVVFASSNGIAGYNLDASTDKVITLDYNNDGYDDLLCYRPGSKAAWLLKSNGNGTFTVIFSNGNGIAGYNLDQTSDQIISLDYNGDGYDDLLCYRPGSKAAWLLKGNGNGAYTAVISSSNGLVGFNLDAASDKIIALDYNKDGLSDIILFRPGGGIAYSAHSNGTIFIKDFPVD